MNKILLISLFTLFLITIHAQEVIYTEDFDGYTNGQTIATQSTNFITWTNNPGSAEDALVSQEQALSGTQSIKIDGTTDVVAIVDDYTSGIFKVNFNIFVAENNGGYFNIQKSSNPGQEWAVEVYLSMDGTAIVETNNQETEFAYTPNEWTAIEINVNLDNSDADILVNGNLITTWQYSNNSNGSRGSLTVGGLNLFAGAPPGETPFFYVDDIVIAHSATVSITELDAAKAGTISPNPATDYFNLTLENPTSASVEIYDMTGRMVKNKTISQRVTNFNVSDLDAGNYLIYVNDGASFFSKRLVID